MRRLILEIAFIRQPFVGGARFSAISLSEEALREGARELGRQEGLWVAPESGAIWAATKQRP